ncbi:MAG: porin [Paracoccus sp. (in: a-proteobacteria)]|nr:porin [Paracoccus sp. (in: a-proteobacteria)]
MKKVLIATTALVLSGGIAAAEVTLSGDGRMGMMYDGNDMQFTSRARVTFTLTGESDTGLSFGGRFRADQATNATAGHRGSVYVSGAYGKLTMGDIDSAAENAVGDLHGVGLTGLGDRNELKYLTSDFEYIQSHDYGLPNGNPGALYEYSVGATTLYASLFDGQALEGRAFGMAISDTGNAWSLGAKHNFGDFTVGAGYERATLDNANNLSNWALSGEGRFGDAAVKAVYARASMSGNDDFRWNQYGISGRYNAGLTTVTGFWLREDIRNVDDKYDSFGIGAEYDLGGGAAFAAGIVDSDWNDDVIADMGIKFRF